MITEREKKRAVAYARYSSAGQRDVSIEQQLQDIRAFAKREGYLLIREYTDHAKSGYKNVNKRAAFQKMMKDAEAGQFDTVLAWKVDRFGRSREDSAIYKGRLRRFGVSVVYAMEPIPEGAAGVLLEGMLEATAEWYSRNLSENVTRGMRDNAMKCLYNGTKVLGYRRGEDGHYEINPEEAPVVRKIFDDYLSGSSAAAIARDLQARGIRTTRAAAWTAQQVLRVLQNERYRGVYIWGDYRTEGGMPAIIPSDKWEVAQDMMKQSKRVVHQDRAADFILTGKLFCGLCGSGMVGDSGTSKTGDRHFYYACLGKKNNHSCAKKSIRKEWIEDTVINFLVDTVLNDEMIVRLSDQVAKEQEKRRKASVLPSMEQELSDVNRQIKNINTAIANGIWSSSTVTILKDLEQQAADLADGIAIQKAAEADFSDRDMVQYLMHRFIGVDRTDPVQRLRLIETFVNSIFVYDDHLRLFVNTVENALQLTFPDLPPEPSGSDNFTDGVQVVIHPNTIEFRIAI